MTHPKTAVTINGKWHFIPCDCSGCERRDPMLGAGIVLAVSSLLAGFIGLLMQGC